MSYQVLARKYRPQRFDDVVGQQAVTRTLRNAIASGRLAHAFVFAGSRGCGKTTTARILAKALNCVNGPTADPCGVCDACVEIAQGRDMDVLEIDAASHTQVDNIREVILAGLAIAPVRDRYKVFIIDEVHQLSNHSFNALLKSIEEPPPHVVFIMATTELHKIPDTILSRSQVFEFRQIAAKAIVEQLKTIAAAEKIDASEAALALVARAAEGSMRDAQSALDQVMAFAGETITVDDAAAVLGLVGRDLLFELIEAVVAEDGPRAFALADRAVESGHDLKLVCRELTRVVRDLMVIGIDPSRAGDGELMEGERDRLAALAGRFSREDLLRAFDLLAAAERDIRDAAHPRYHFEMALLKWMHLRKLVPLADLLEQLGGGSLPAKAGSGHDQMRAGSHGDARAKAEGSTTSAAASALRAAAGRSAAATAAAAPRLERPAAIAKPPAPAAASPARASASRFAAPAPAPAAPDARATQPASAGGRTALAGGELKDALLAEIRAGKGFFYNTVVAQAQKIEVGPEGVVFTFSPQHKALRDQFEQSRAWLEAAAERLAQRRLPVTAVQGSASADQPAGPAPAAAPARDDASGGAAARDLKAEVQSSPAVQAMLDVFPAEIRDVEEM